MNQEKKIDKRVKTLQEEYARRAEERKDLERTWLICMNYYAGNQYAELMPTGAIARTAKKYPWQMTSVFNHIAPIIESRLAKFNKMKTDVSCFPASTEEKDVLSSLFSSRLIRAAQEENAFKKKVEEGAFWAEICGTAFYKVCWSKDKGPLVADGVRDGDVEITVCPPYELYPDDLTATDVNACNSIIHARAYPVETVEKRFGVRVKSDDPGVMTKAKEGKSGAFSDRKEGFVLVLEEYVAPTVAYPDGRLLIVAGDSVLYDGVLPYVTERENGRGFPFVRQVAIPSPASFFGNGLVERMIPIQRAYNELKNRKHEFFNRITAGVIVAEDGSVDVDELAEDGIAPGKIIVYRQGCNPPQMLNLGSVPAEFGDEEDRLLKEFITVSGVSDFMLTGTINDKNYSGAALSVLTEQNNNRLCVTTESIKSAIREVAVKTLRLYKQFATDERLKALENGNEGEADAFRNSDLRSDDLALETENGNVDSVADKRGLAKQIYEMNLLTDENGKMSEQGKRKLLALLGCEGFAAPDLQKEDPSKTESEIKNTETQN